MDLAEKIQAEDARILAAIGDIPLDRLAELCQAEREGRCVVLPCKIGDAVYFDDVAHYSAPPGHVPRIREVEVENITIAKPYWRINGYDEEFLPSDFGTSAFLAREAAEAALREREQNG